MPRLALLGSLVLAAVGATALATPSAASAASASSAPSGDTSAARLSTRQTVTGDAVFRGSPVAALGADALRSAHGNFGVNVAAGALNVQSNQIVQAAASQVSVDTRQVVRSAAAIAGASSAALGERALMGASGNIGVNVAAGAANAQANAMAIH